MFKAERSANEPETSEYGAAEHPVDITNGKKPARKVALAATVTCPSCSFANKPEWVNKARTGDSYSTTLFCEQCGSLLAVWARHVETQVVTQQHN
jgi:DNA-directed RNA polymerase subunit M/transcription elongation factor TFIIS